MLDKINPKKIIRDHLATLQDNRTNRTSIGDIILFFIVPLAISFVMLGVLRLRIGRDAIGFLTTSLSVFAALLFNLLLLVYDIVSQEKENAKKAMALREIFANISFSILVSICSVILLLINYVLYDSLVQWPDLFQDSLNFVIYWFVGSFLLTLFMILKRVHILLSKEFE